jgi:fluoroacetyl-CoA thioesterase
MGSDEPVTISAGLEATVELSVGEDMTAEAVGSGDLPVLATPAVLALVERAAVAAVAGALPAGTTSVGASVELAHLAPTPVGATVRATAHLDAVQGRRLTFSFMVIDDVGRVAEGRHVRALVDRERFLSPDTRRAS